MMTTLRALPLWALVTTAAMPSLAAQSPAQPATRYDSLFDQLMGLSTTPVSSADVSGLTIRRDAATFTLQSGRLYTFGSIGGRIIAAAFVGQGKFRFIPPTRLEQGQLERTIHADTLDRPFTSLFFLFADSTAEELGRSAAASARGPVPDEVAGIARKGIGYLSNRGKRYFDSHFMTALLNDEHNESFFAAVGGIADGPFVFRVDPYEEEETTLGIGKVGDAWEDSRSVQVNRFHWARDYVDPGKVPHDWKQRFSVMRYVIDATIPSDLKFRASATLEFDWWGAAQQWFSMWLLPDLKVDSASWGPGVPAKVVRPKDNSVMWIERPPVVSGQPMPKLTIYYHGELFAADPQWIELKTSNGWYPGPEIGYGSPLTSAFDLTFHTPRKQAFASIGELVHGDTLRDIVNTHWTTREPVTHASFNIGRFEVFELKRLGSYPVTVFINQEAHDQLPSAVTGRNGEVIVIPRQARMGEAVGEDVALSLTFFRDAFGDPPVSHFYATEIPGGHGQAFPGLIHLSWLTYHGFLLKKGEDEAFRSHEMAHQWWGLGVGPKSYRDAWLSEGFATFASWWYTETVLQDSSAMRDLMKRSKTDLMTRRKQAGPIWLGTRLVDGEVPQDYSLIVYEKGAWVLRMLKNLMADPDSGDAAFRRMIKDFYDNYRGGQASTEDFKQIVSLHTRAPMDWFFNSWVYGTGIPTYEWAQTTVNADGQLTWKLQVQQKNVPDDFAMIVPVHFYFDNGQEAMTRVLVRGPTTDFSAALPAKLKRVVFNESDAVLAEVKEGRWR